MKNLLLLFFALLISQSAFAQNKFWTGATNSDWNTASNWSPSGVPTSSNDVYLTEGTNSITLSSGTVTVKSINLRGSGRTLTVNSGATLRLIGDAGAYAVLLMTDRSLMVNNGTVALETSGGGAITGWFLPSPTTTVTNNGILRINTTFNSAIEMGNPNSNTGQATGTATITNNTCGRIIITSGNFQINANNISNVNNAGLIQVARGIDGSGTFTNQSGGVVIRNGGSQAIISNNSSVIVNNNPTNSTIFSYTGTFTGTVNGIFTNSAATTSAGSFTAPNTFTPSGSLPLGSQTLYAKITPSGGACDYVVPFTYNNVLLATLTVGTATNPITCGGNGSIAFTSTNIPNGNYSLSFTATGAGATNSPQNVTVANNAFSLTGLKAGTYSNFSMTVSGSPVSASTSRTLSNPASPTLTAGTVTNPTTCGGNGSIAFTSTNLTNGSYSLSFTATGATATASPQNITVSGNAFSLTGLKAGTYSNFSVINNGCTGTAITSKTVTDPAAPTLTAGAVTNPTTCGGNGSIAFASTNLPNGTYSLSFTATGAGATASPQNITVSGNAFSLTGLKAGTYSNFSVTSNGCTGSVTTSRTVADPASPTLTAGTVTNPTICGGNGSIAFTSTNLPNGTYSLTFTATGTFPSNSPQNITVSNNAFSLNGLRAGTYSNFSVTANNCIGTTATSKTLTDPPTPGLTLGTVTQPTTCGGTGSAAFTTTNISNGTYTLNFRKTSTGATTQSQSIQVTNNAFTLSNLSPDTYGSFEIAVNGCGRIISNSFTIASPASPALIAGTVTNPTTCGGNGSIAFNATNLPNGTYSLSFTATGAGATTSPQSITISSTAFTLNGLKAGTYSNFSITNPTTNCTGSLTNSITVADPATPTLTAGTITNPTTCGGNGSIAFTSTNLPNASYSLSFTPTGAGATSSPRSITVSGNAFSLTGLKAGTYSGFSVTRNGCTGTDATSKTVADPASPTIMAGAVTNPTTCGGNGSIAFTSNNVTNGTYSLSFSATGAGATNSPQNVTVSGNAFSLTGLKAGTYSNFSLIANNCTGSDATSKTVTDPVSPTLTAGNENNPSTCGGTDGSIAFTTTNLPNGNYSLSYTGTGSPKSVTVFNNAFNLTGLSSGGYSNFSITNNGCTGTANTSKSLSDPAAPLLFFLTSTNPTACNLSDGTIAFTVTNVTDGNYSLTFSSTGTASPRNVTVNSGTATLTGLADGQYSNFSITNTSGCTGALATEVTLTDLALPVLTVGAATNPTTCTGTNGTIAFTTANLPNGNYSLSFTTTGTSSPQNIVVANNAFTLSGLSAGAYSNFSVTNSGCTGTVATARTLTNPASPTLTVGVKTDPTTCSGTDGSINFSTINLPNGNYSLTFATTGTPSPKNVTVSNNAFELEGLVAGTYSDFSVTNAGCTGSVATSLTLNNPPTPTISAGVVIAPTTCSAADGSIAFTSTNLPNGSYTLTYTGAGSPKTVTITSNAFSLTGLDDGTYSNFSITYLNCTASSNISKTVTNPTAPSLTVGLGTNPSTCLSSDGTIAFTTGLTNGNYTLNYTGAGNSQSITVASGAFTLSGLPDGTYSNFSITSSGCTSSAATSRTLTDPNPPTLTAGTATNPTTCLSADGTIPFTTSLTNGSYSVSYTGSGSPQNVTVNNGAFTLTGLPDGTYSGFSVTVGGCTGIANVAKILTDPAAPTLTAGTATNPTTCSGADGTIPFTTSLSNGNYSLSFTGTGSPKSVTVASGAFTVVGLSAGTYSGFSVTTGGCTGTDNTSKTLSDPPAITITAGTATNPTTCLSSDGSIAFTTNLSNGNYTLNYTGAGSPKSVTVANGAFTLSGLPDGTFSGFSITNNGCTGSDNINKTLTDPNPPTLTAGTATNPTTCLSADGTIPFTTSLANGSYSLSYTGTGSPQNVTVNNGAFTLGNLPDGTFSGFSVTVGGCTGIANTTKTLTDPTPPTLTAGTPMNPTTCTGFDGSISFTTTNLASGNYLLNFTGSGSPKNITVNNNAFILSGLSAGTYSGFSVTTGGCTGIDNSTKILNDPTAPTITAGTAVNPTTCAGTNGSIPFTTNLGDGNYSLSYTGTGSPKNVTVSSGTFSLTGLSAGAYSNFSITNNGCTGTDASSKTLNDPTAPTITATGSTVCSGATATLSTTATGTYTWTGVNGFSSTEQIPSILNATVSATGTYQVIVTNSNACTAIATASITVNPIPTTPTANAVAPINAGASVTLTATGCTGTLKWFKSSDNTVVTMPVTPLATMNYYAKCEETANGITCESPQSANVTVTVITVQIVYVNGANTNPSQDGTTWTKAFSNLQDGLTVAASMSGTPVEVWVAQGTYKPTTTTTRTIYFNIPSGVKVYGGFVGTENDLTARNFRTNITTLNGDIGAIGTTSDNSYHVVNFDGSNNTTLLDGFTVTGGSANFDPRRTINAPGFSPSTFATIETGGGIILQNASSPIIANCTIINNTAVTGGGIYAGGASMPKIIACKITSNQSTFGAGIYFQDGSNGSMTNTLIAGNKGVGAVYNNKSNTQITNCTIAGNGGYNGGIFNSASQPVVKNSIIWNNSTPFNDTQSIITNSTIQGGYVGTGNLNNDPLFINSVPEGLSPNANGDYHLQGASLAVDRGDNTGISLTDVDLDGNLRRFNGGIVDMGAYEFLGVATANIIMSAQTGDWESNSTWIGLKVPVLGDIVIIDSNHIVTINTTATAKTIEYRATGQVKFNSATAKLNIGF
jgi:parallel beta-helix repeat protein